MFYCFIKNDRTLLQIAASQGHKDTVEHLLNKKIGHIGFLKYVLMKKVDVDIQDKVCVASLKDIC